MFKKKKNNPQEPKKHSWFDDDDDWVNLRSKVVGQSHGLKRDLHSDSAAKRHHNPSAFDVPKDELEKVEVNIKLTVPKLGFLKWNKQRFKSNAGSFGARLKSKTGIAVVFLLLLAAGVVVGKATIFNHKENTGAVAGANDGAGNPKQLPVEKPTFPILYPGGKNYDTVGKVVKISPPGNDPVYTYIDSLSGFQINVSQQQLPEKFKTAQDRELEALAKDFQATDLLKVDSVNVWHGRSEKGVESLLFIKGNLLVTIRSSQPISDDTWAAYISALHS